MLRALSRHYGVILAAGARVASYETLYFDVPELRGYDDHVRGRAPRHKVRARHYPDRGVSFLEVKSRTNRGRTEKTRRPLASLAALLFLAPPPRAPDAPGSPPDLFALADGVAELTSRDPLGADPALRRLGAVSDWLAPPRARSLGLDSIVPPSDVRTAGGDVP